MITYVANVTVKVDSTKKVSKRQIHTALEAALIDDEFVLLVLEQELDIPADKFELKVTKAP